MSYFVEKKNKAFYLREELEEGGDYESHKSIENCNKLQSCQNLTFDITPKKYSKR